MFAVKLCATFLGFLVYGQLILGDVTDPSISPSGAGVVREGDGFTWTCSATCTVSCSYSWSRDVGEISGTISGNGKEIIFSSISRTDDGGYSCQIDDMNDTISLDSTTVPTLLTVWYGPDSVLLSPSNTTYVIIEKSAFSPVQCSPVACGPSCTTRWDRTSGATTDTVAENGTLAFPSTERSIAGTYRCTTTHDETHDWKEINVVVTVHYGPDSVLLSPSNTTYVIIERSAVSPVQCSPVACGPSCTTRWDRTSGATTDTVAENGTLAFPSTERSIAGTYRCTTTNDETHDKKEINVTVTVHYAPDVNMTWLDDSHELECQAAGVPDTYTFHNWQHWVGETMVREIPGIQRGNGKQVLQFSNATYMYMETGNYKCIVDNDVIKWGEESKLQTESHDRTFHDSPLVVSSEPNYNVSKGDPVELTIYIYAIPAPTVAVSDMLLVPSDTNVTETLEGVNITIVTADMTVTFHDVHVIVPGSRVHIRFATVKEEYFGNYNITIGNEEGNTQASISISPQGIPDPPFNLAVQDLSQTTVTLVFNSGFYNGANQSFLFYYRTSASAEWREGPTVHVGELKMRTEAVIQGLEPETFYMFTSHGYNIYGNSSYDNEAMNATTLAEPVPYAVIVGGSAGGVAAILLVILIIFLVRRRACCSRAKPSQSSLAVDMNDIIRSGDEEPAYVNHNTRANKESVLYANTAITPVNNDYENAAVNPQHKRNVAVVQPLPTDGDKESLYYNVHSPKQEAKPGPDDRSENIYKLPPPSENIYKLPRPQNGPQSPEDTVETPVAVQPLPPPTQTGASNQTEPTGTDTEDTYLDMDLSKSSKDQKDKQNTSLIQNLKKRLADKPVIREVSNEMYMDMKIPSSKRPDSVPDFLAPPPPPPPVTESVYMNLHINGEKK